MANHLKKIPQSGPARIALAIPARLVKKVDRMAKQESKLQKKKVTRSEIVRQAIAYYVGA